MSQVSEQIAGLTSYTGFFTVNETYNGNIFFWFFPAQVSTHVQYLYIYYLVVPCDLAMLSPLWPGFDGEKFLI